MGIFSWLFKKKKEIPVTATELGIQEVNKITCPVCRHTKPCLCGAPPKLDIKQEKEIIQSSKNYLDSCEEKEKDGRVIKANLPSLAGLAVWLGTSIPTLYYFSEKSQEFSKLIEKLRAFQESRLIEGGITGKYNPTIAKLILTKHGYSDKQQTDMNIKSISLTKLFNASKNETER